MKLPIFFISSFGGLISATSPFEVTESPEILGNGLSGASIAFSNTMSAPGF